MRVSVKLFAMARQRAGQGEVTLELPEPATVADVRGALARTIPALAPFVPNLMIAVDASYASDSDPVSEASEIAAIPPVSGGQTSD